MNFIIRSTLKSPRKLEPKVAFVPMPASVAPRSCAIAIVRGQASISCIWERLALRRTNTSHMWQPSDGRLSPRSMVSGGEYSFARSMPRWLSARAV